MPRLALPCMAITAVLLAAISAWLATASSGATAQATAAARTLAAYEAAETRLAAETPAQYAVWATLPIDSGAVAAQAAASFDQALPAIPGIDAVRGIHDRYIARAQSLLATAVPQTATSDLVAQLRPLYSAVQSELDAAVQEQRAAVHGADADFSATILRIAVPAGLLLEAILFCLVFRSTNTHHSREAAALQEELDRVLRDSSTDPITGLGNLLSFERELHQEVARGLRHDSSVALALVDVDAYKTVSDIDGQMAADAMLTRLGAFLRGRRAEDQSFRLNGGQFAIILPYTTAREIYPLMEHLRTETERGGHGTTVTIGISDLLPVGDTAENMRKRAETAVAEGKRRGRNTVVALPARRPDALAPTA